jgi:hypothetical protein
MNRSITYFAPMSLFLDDNFRPITASAGDQPSVLIALTPLMPTTTRTRPPAMTIARATAPSHDMT